VIRVIFSDTNFLISLFCFPSSTTQPSLAYEIAEAAERREISLLVVDVVAAEFEKVIQRDFLGFAPLFEKFLSLHNVVKLPEPTFELLTRAQKVCADPNDVEICAAAVQSAELYKVEYLLSNDFQNFHTPDMKAFLLEYDIIPISLYGLLKLLGKRP